MEIMEALRHAYGVYDKAINKVFADLGLEDGKGTVSSRVYPLLPTKKLEFSVVKKGYIDSDKLVYMMVDDAPFTKTWNELVSIVGLMRYQLKINHAVEDNIVVSEDVSVTIGKKEFTIVTKDTGSLVLTIPEIFVVLEAVEKAWNEK